MDQQTCAISKEHLKEIWSLPTAPRVPSTFAATGLSMATSWTSAEVDTETEQRDLD